MAKTNELIPVDFWKKSLSTVRKYDGAYLVNDSLIALDSISNPAVDEDAVTVRMKISSERLDRDNEVVIQDGISLANYKNNPVVLFSHGLAGIVTPVAMSEDRNGNLTVTKSSDGTYATAYHIAADKQSMQFFELVNHRLLRAASIGLNPVSPIRMSFINGRKAAVLEQTDMVEWSYCAVGMNPDALVMKSLSPRTRQFIDEQADVADMLLRRNKLDGSSIDEPLKLFLKSLVP